MSILHVRNVPEDLHGRIRERARAEKRSISGEVITLLEQALATSERSQAEILTDIRRRRFIPPPDVPDSTALLREDRNR